MVGEELVGVSACFSPLAQSGPGDQLVEGLGLTLAEIDALTGEDPLVAKTFDEIGEELGLSGVPNLFRTLALNPEELRATWQRFKSHLLAGRFPILAKLTAGLALARQEECEYMRRLFGHLLFLYGADPNLLHLVWQGKLVEALELLPVEERPVVEVMLSLAEEPADNPGLDDRLAEYDAEERMELILATLTLSELIRLVKRLGVPTDRELALRVV